MRKKVLTPECVSCDDMNTNDAGSMLCHWGNGKPKLLVPHKGKKPRFCKLIKRNHEVSDIPTS